MFYAKKILMSFFHKTKQDRVNMLDAAAATFTWLYLSCWQSEVCSLQPFAACFLCTAAVYLWGQLRLCIMHCCLSTSISSCWAAESLASTAHRSSGGRCRSCVWMECDFSRGKTGGEMQSVIFYPDDERWTMSLQYIYILPEKNKKKALDFLVFVAYRSVVKYS